MSKAVEDERQSLIFAEAMAGAAEEVAEVGRPKKRGVGEGAKGVLLPGAFGLEVSARFDETVKANFLRAPIFPFAASRPAHFEGARFVLFEDLRDAWDVSFGNVNGKLVPVGAVGILPIVGDDDWGAAHFHGFVETIGGGTESARAEGEETLTHDPGVVTFVGLLLGRGHGPGASFAGIAEVGTWVLESEDLMAEVGGAAGADEGEKVGTFG